MFYWKNHWGLCSLCMMADHFCNLVFLWRVNSYVYCMFVRFHCICLLDVPALDILGIGLVLARRACVVSFVQRGKSGLGFCYFSLSENRKDLLDFWPIASGFPSWMTSATEIGLQVMSGAPPISF